MISAVAILMLCNGIRMSPRSEKNTINEIGCVMEFMTHLFRFFIFSFLHFFHRISRMNRRHSCLSDYSRNFAELWPLARARYMLLLFFVTQISQMTQIFLCVDYFVPQISQMTQIFLCVDYFVTQISQIYADFSLWRLFRHADFADDADFSLWDIFQFQGVSAPTGQVASAKIRE